MFIKEKLRKEEYFFLKQNVISVKDNAKREGR
jgi:hypothetical protein